MRRRRLSLRERILLAIFLPFPAAGLALKVLPEWAALPVALLAATVPFWDVVWKAVRLNKRIDQFRRLSGQRLTLCYAPELEGTMDFTQFLQLCEQTLETMEQELDCTLSPPPEILLFPTTVELQRWFDEPMGGAAFQMPLLLGKQGKKYVFVAADAFQSHPEELVGHELAHLFSWRWGNLEPPFKSEGFAQWMRKSIDGKPVDLYALAHLLGDPYFPLPLYLLPSIWESDKHRSYAIAGSFTGFLILRFGWDAYRQFFRRANAKNFETAFQEVFGLTFRAAERKWLNELLMRRQEFEPELSALVLQRRILTDYGAWMFIRCLEGSEQLLNANQADMRILWIAATAVTYIGDYERAVQWFKQLLQSDDETVRSYRGMALVQLGNLYDLIGERNEAVQAYKQALSEPDVHDWHDVSIHRRARNYLHHPFTEEELLKPIKRRWMR